MHPLASGVGCQKFSLLVFCFLCRALRFLSLLVVFCAPKVVPGSFVNIKKKKMVTHGFAYMYRD